MSVRILEEQVVNQIAAGEVVERPASVVKELIENALDAKSTVIAVQLKNGGRSLIRVVDDGVGMNRQDALMCLERHATSKILTAADLKSVGTLGFRGEAIPAIASVSRFNLVTRPVEDEVGTEIQIEGGRLGDVSATGCAAGTEVSVRSLFYNTPARRKFMRTKATELAHCLEAITQQALIRHRVDFTVEHEGKTILRAPATVEQASRARLLAGDLGPSLLPVDFGGGGVRLAGLISGVGTHKSTARGAMYLYVNGRFVRDPLLRRAIYEAYRELVPKGRYPVVILNLLIDPAMVDVNVHPTKSEVRFVDGRELFQRVSQGLRDVLHSGSRPPKTARRVAPTSTRPIGQPDLALPREYPPAETISAHPDNDPRFDGVTHVVAEPTPSMATLPHRYRDLRVIGQFQNTYIVCENDGEMVLIDQHAAHERIRLYQLQRDRKGQLGAIQRQLHPILVELPRPQAEMLRENLDILHELKLEVQPVGSTGFAIVGIPTMLDKADIQQVVRDIADELLGGIEGTTIEDQVGHLLATMACHSAIRAMDELTPYEMRALLASLDEIDFQVCAHGRPVALRIAVTELANRFHRT